MDYKAARKAMVASQVRPNDVTDHRVLNALETTPKEAFLPVEHRATAYVEREIIYGSGRSLPTARDFAKLLQALELRPGDLVLDVACGGGYSTAVLARIVEMVVAVENDEALASAAEAALEKNEIANAAVIIGEPAEGAPDQGPFDAIFISEAVEEVPEALLAQLKDGGRLGAFLVSEGVGEGVIFRRSADAVSRRSLFTASARNVPPGFERKREFVF